MRNPVACVTCRSAKQKCIYRDAPPCDRCTAAGRAAVCKFPLPGTSSIHRRPKRARCDDGRRAGAADGADGADAAAGSGTAAEAPPPGLTSLPAGLDPFALLTDDEVQNSYLRCAYKWSFHHTPTLLLRIRDRTLEIWMAWAMLALAIRFVKAPPRPFRTQTEASNVFAAHARQLLQADLETPSISRVQALLMLTGHDWGAGNGRRAWIYLGMAIRLVEVMELYRELPPAAGRRLGRDDFIEAEVRRRTAWTCFLMDALLSGGKGRKRSLQAADMAIQLPCEREDFVFGTPVQTDLLGGAPPSTPLSTPQHAHPTGQLGIIAYTLRAANIWGKVARWACSDVVNSELPWSPDSEFQRLVFEIDEWKKSLPERLQYDLFLLHSHNAVDQGQAYCYMHCIYFMSYMFLHRAYLPVLGPQNSTDEGPSSYSERAAMWKDWQKKSRRELFRESTMVLEMLDEMRSFGVYFLRGLVPWIGFTIYTAVGVMLYSYNFPSDDDDPIITEKARDRVIRGCTFLKDMQAQWPMAETWFKTIKRMQAYYWSTAEQEDPVSPDERRELRRAMIDYGALQPSPVQRPVHVKSSDASTVSEPNITEAPTSIPPPTLVSPISTVNGHSSTEWTAQNFIPPLDDTFDFSFDFSDADMESLMMNATQDFWASFPGEVGADPYS